MSLVRRPAEEGGFTTFKRRRPKPSRRSQDPVTAEVYDRVFRRDGVCLLRGSKVPEFTVACAGRDQWCHRLGVSYGGPATVVNGWRGCALHHARSERYRDAARALGLFLRRGDDPSQVPVTLWDGRRVLLTPTGGMIDI